MPEASQPAIGELLADSGTGDREAFRAVIPVLCDQLHQVAHPYSRKARAGHTLQTTALLHEAYLRLEEHHQARFENRAHFVAIPALLMRKILIGHGRTRRAAKRGAGGENLTLDDAHAVMKGRPVDLIALDDALTELARLDLQQTELSNCGSSAVCRSKKPQKCWAFPLRRSNAIGQQTGVAAPRNE